MNHKSADHKPQGEMVELAFMAKAARLGFTVAKPYGDSLPYDIILDNGRALRRVQVRSSSSKVRAGYYRIHARHGSHGNIPLTPADVDAIVAYVIPEDAWYVVPARALPGGECIWLFPHRQGSQSRFERYREAWHLLRS